MNKRSSSGITIEGGHLSREFSMPPKWYARIPELSEEGARLLFGPVNNLGANVDRSVTFRELLDEFMKLRTAPAKRILRFAKKWGSLNLCEHGLPPRHSEASRRTRHALLEARLDEVNRRLLAAATAEEVASLQAKQSEVRDEMKVSRSIPACPLPIVGLDGQEWDPDAFVFANPERLDDWRWIATHFWLIHESARSLRDDHIPLRRLWPGIRSIERGVLMKRLEDSDSYPAAFGESTSVLERMRSLLGELIDLWMSWCPLRLRCVWDDYAPAVYFAPAGNPTEGTRSVGFGGDETLDEPLLLPLLVLQLSAAVLDFRPVKRRCRFCKREIPVSEIPSRGRPRQICERRECQALALKKRKDKFLRNLRKKMLEE